MNAPATAPGSGLHIDAAVGQARAEGLDSLDAQLLLAYVLQRPRVWLLAHGDEALAAPAAAAYGTLVAQRAQGVPLAYLVGEREFRGLRLRVSPAVLVPRPDTETLVDWALQCLAGELAAVDTPEVLDLGTGSGAIALAIKHAAPQVQLTATDLSAEALAVAQANGEALGLPVRWLQGPWWQPLAGERFHLVLSNPPYIAEDDVHLAALRHEPALALTPGGDGLGALRQIVQGAGEHLLHGGWLLLEHGHDQAAAVRELLAAAGFAAIGSRADLAGHLRCSGGRWRGGS